MKHYEQEKVIADMLTKHGVDLSSVVIGTGDYNTANQDHRFVFHIANREQIVNETAKYAIKYFHSHGIYILWKIRGYTGSRYVNRTSLSIDAEAVLNAVETRDNAFKGVEFHWKASETVHIFDYSGLEHYIAENFEDCMN